MSKLKHQPYTAFKLWLAGHGITYKDVAKVIGCTESTVMQKISGASDFYVNEIQAICAAFGCPMRLFFEANVA